MDPIINPWLIYLAELSGWVKLASFMGAGFVLVTALVQYIDYSEEYTAYRLFQMPKPPGRPDKMNFIIGGILLILWLLVPSSDTVYKMIAAHYITPDAVDNLDKVLQSLIQAIKEVR